MMRESGVAYRHVCYIGDGKHDYCPTLAMTSNDIVFAREGNFKLHPLIQANRDGVKAKVVPWESGQTIQQTLERLGHIREE